MTEFYMETYGCSRRYLDAERINSYFVSNGLKRTMSPLTADYLIVVSCGLTRDKEDAVMDAVIRLKRFKGRMLVYGCMPAMNAERIGAVYSGDTLATKDIDNIDDFFPEFSNKFKDIGDANRIIASFPNPLKKFISSFIAQSHKNEGLPDGIGFDERIFTLRVSEGCLGSCSYCNIRKAIGTIKSKPVQKLLEELDRYPLNMRLEINLISSDTGAYGLDIGSSFPELLSAVLNKNDGIVIKFIQDLHPYWICKYSEQLIELLSTRRIKSILTAVQSGNPRILKLMKRWVDLGRFAEIIGRMKNIYPDLKLRTQVIAGFPSETEQEFQDTIEYVNHCGFDEVDIFAYYETDGTDSAGIKPDIPRKIVLERVNRMRRSIRARKRISI